MVKETALPCALVESPKSEPESYSTNSFRSAALAEMRRQARSSRSYPLTNVKVA